MTIGQQLLVACIKHNSTKIFSAIDRKWLDGDEYKEYRFIADYYRDNGELVGLKAFCSKYSLDAKEVDARPSYYLKAIRERFIFASIADKVPKIMKGAKESPMDKLNELQELVSALSLDAVDNKDVLYSEDTDTRIKSYEERAKTSGVTYLSMGCEDLDKTFYGYYKTDLITIGGKAGAGKSWLLVFLIYVLDKVIRDKEDSTFGDILLITNEMGEDEIKERIDCLRFKLPYKEFLQGTLTSREKRRYFKGLKMLASERSKIRIVYSCQTIDDLTTLMGLYHPSAVFIDGSYLMEPKLQEGWEKIVYVTRNLKRLAKTFQTPIINTTQLKRGALKSGSKFALDGQDEFAYSSSYAQDSDIAIRMYQDADMKFHDLIALEVVKGRRVISGTTLIFQNDLANMNHSITLPAIPSESPEFKELD